MLQQMLSSAVLVALQSGLCHGQPFAHLSAQAPTPHWRLLTLRVGQRLRAAWRRCLQDEHTAYLGRSVDHVDLERRIRTWDEIDDRYRMSI